MHPELASYFPWFAGALGLTVSGIVTVLKGYKWLLGEIRQVIVEQLGHHEARESEWQKGIERRLDVIEQKVDALIEGRS